MRLCFTTTTFHVQNMIDRDPIEPRAELTLTLKGAQPRDGFEQHFLRDFFGIMRLENHPHRDIVNPGLMSENQGFQRSTVSVAGPLNQFDILPGIVIGF